jgi:glutathione peroxidase
MLRAPLLGGKSSGLPILAPGTVSKQRRRSRHRNTRRNCLALIVGVLALSGVVCVAVWKLSNPSTAVETTEQHKNAADAGTKPGGQHQKQQEEKQQEQEQENVEETTVELKEKDSESLYDNDFVVTDIAGKEFKLASLRGKVTLIVNVASQCGYTKTNYDGLTKLYSKYGAHGLEILAFPCSAFGNQEPWENSKIQSYVKDTFNATFPVMAKVEDVNTHPVFDWLRSHLSSSSVEDKVHGSDGDGDRISWNFNKFLVGKNGHVAKRYDSSFDIVQLEHDVYELLLQKT